MAQTIPVADNGYTGQAVSDNIDDNFTELYDRVDAIELDDDVDYLKYTPQGVAPTYVEGTMYYGSGDGTMRIQGPFSDVEIKIGHGMHIHVENNSGDLIEKGMAITQTGVVNGKIQIKKAIADTFDNARLIGITSHDIPNTAEGAATTFGEIEGLKTDTLTAGIPLYLSDTIAGTFVEIAPDIVTRVGGVTVSDASDGILFVFIINNKNLPNIFGGMQGQTAGNETYSLTAVEQDIINYETETTQVVAVDKLAGTITLPNDGSYRIHVNAAISFVTSTSTRTVYIELYDVTNDEIHFTYAKNIPRSATEDSLGFSWAFNELADNVHSIRIRASDTFDVTFENISFDIQSISIQ